MRLECIRGGRFRKRNHFRRKVGTHWFRKFQRNFEPKAAAFANDTLDSDLPAHETYELPGDCGSEAGSAIDSGNRVIRLCERFKDLCLFGLRNADTGVSDFNSNPS